MGGIAGGATEAGPAPGDTGLGVRAQALMRERAMGAWP